MTGGRWSGNGAWIVSRRKKGASQAGVPYTTTVLAGTADLGSVGIRLVSILWLLAALAFIAAGVATYLDDISWRTLVLGTTVASLALTLIALPQSRIGLVLNLVLITYLLAGLSLGWLPGKRYQ